MTMPRRITSTLFALAAVPALVLGLAACAPGSGDDGDPRVKSESEIAAAAEKWNAAFDTCLASEGIDTQPSEDGSKPGIQMGGAQEESMNTCTDKVSADLGPRPVTADEKKMVESWKEEGLKSAKCLRGKGYDVADPTADMGIEIPDGVSDEDLETCGVGMGGMSTVEER
jgi:hypothetical protein